MIPGANRVLFGLTGSQSCTNETPRTHMCPRYVNVDPPLLQGHHTPYCANMRRKMFVFHCRPVVNVMPLKLSLSYSPFRSIDEKIICPRLDLRGLIPPHLPKPFDHHTHAKSSVRTIWSSLHGTLVLIPFLDGHAPRKTTQIVASFVPRYTSRWSMMHPRQRTTDGRVRYL